MDSIVASSGAPARRFRGSWIVMTLLAVSVTVFAAGPYLSMNREASAIPINPNAFLHYAGLVAHAVTGGVALLIGPFQFLHWLRARKPALHRALGRVYIVAVLLGASMALYSALVSTAGFVAQLGFGVLAILWLYSVLRALAAIRAGRIQEHRLWMTRNFALTFAAVVLRVWLGAGIAVLVVNGSFDGNVSGNPVYTSAAWISWVAPLLVTEWFIVPRILGRSTGAGTGGNVDGTVGDAQAAAAK